MTQLVLIPANINDPIDPTDQATRVPGIDAPCPRDLARACGWPYCTCINDLLRKHGLCLKCGYPLTDEEQTRGEVCDHCTAELERKPDNEGDA